MRIEETILRLLIQNPFYGYIAAAIHPVATVAQPKMKVTAFPVMTLHYNPDWYDSLSDKEQEQALVHELLHLILMHGFRRGHRQPALWAVACDMAVNEHVNQEALGRDAVTVPKIAHMYGVFLERRRSAEFYYDKLIENEASASFTTAQERAVVILESDSAMNAEILADEDASEADIKGLRAQIAELMEASADDKGPMPELQVVLNDVYSDFKVDWRTVLKRFLSGRGKTIVRKSYKRKSRRYETLPGTKRTHGVKALLAIDESGSISDDLLEKFYRELKAINKIAGADQNTLWVLAGQGQNPTAFGHTLVFEA